MKHSITENQSNKSVEMEDMCVGDIAVILTGPCIGDYVFRFSAYIVVSLSSAGSYYDPSADRSLPKVRILPKGAQLILTVGGGDKSND